MALEGIINARDISTASDEMSISPSKLIRTGCVSRASSSDIKHLHDEIGMKVLIDLRSPKEIEKDEDIFKGAVYSNYVDYKYDKKIKFFKTLGNAESNNRRYFISLMNESMIRNEVFKRLKKRARAKAFLYLGISTLPLGSISEKFKKKLRQIFLKHINDGGLKLLNELVLDRSGYKIAAVMKILADVDNLPAAIYCTAGKDRTGIISMLVLSVLGATDNEILQDYVHSDSAYADIGDKDAVVVAMSQKDVDPKVFLRAKPDVMAHVLDYVRTRWGSINGYLDQYGFDEGWRNKMRTSMILNY